MVKKPNANEIKPQIRVHRGHFMLSCLNGVPSGTDHLMSWAMAQQDLQKALNEYQAQASHSPYHLRNVIIHSRRFADASDILLKRHGTGQADGIDEAAWKRRREILEEYRKRFRGPSDRAMHGARSDSSVEKGVDDLDELIILQAIEAEGSKALKELVALLNPLATDEAYDLFEALSALPERPQGNAVPLNLMVPQAIMERIRERSKVEKLKVPQLTLKLIEKALAHEEFQAPEQ